MIRLVSSGIFRTLSLRPDPVPRIQETYFASLEGQLLATGILVALVVLGTSGTARFQDVVRRRYGTQLAEASSVALLAAVVAIGVYAFSVIWHVTFVLDTRSGRSRSIDGSPPSSW